MLRSKPPLKPRDLMKEHERWNGHLVFLTISTTLATALIAGLATIFSDPGKIQNYYSRIFIVCAAFFVLLTLLASIFATAKLANYLVGGEAWPRERRRMKGKAITIWAGIAFYALFFSGLFLFLFFLWTVFLPREVARSQSENNCSLTICL